MKDKRRQLIKMAGAGFVLQLMPAMAWAAKVARFVDVRLWPADEYTRVTLEHDGKLEYKYFILENPWRLVVDILDTHMDKALREITDRLKPHDPYIGRIRAGQFDDNTVRIVFDLKTEVKPEVFSIDPVAEYKNRFVLDFYPAKPVDPLLSLLDESNGLDYRQDDLARALELAGVDAKEIVPSRDGKTLEVKEVEGKSSGSDVKSSQTSAGPGSGSGETQKPVAKKDKQEEVKRVVTVAIDPGHGGEDPGAIGRGGSREKDVVLAIGQMLKEEIDRLPGMRAMLTRNGDFFVPLNKRVAKARAVRADLFVSVHADAFIKPTARGSSVFVLSERGASSSAAKWLAKKENDSDLIGGVNIASTDSQLAKVLLDLSTTAQINDSLKLGSAVLSQLAEINKLHKPRVEQAGFAVLKAPDIPSILIETAFISNPDEEKKLRDKAYQRKMAKAIAEGIKEYFDRNPPVARSTVA